MDNAKADFALVWKEPETGRKLCLGIIEYKKDGAAVNFLRSDAVRQTVCYSLTAMAYSRWGVLKWTEQLVSLLVFQGCLCRLVLSKPCDYVAKPFGLNLRIEFTTDPKIMGWVFNEYIQDLKRDWNKCKSIPGTCKVNPRSWLPINFFHEIEEEDEEILEPNLGFVFRTKLKTMAKLKPDLCQITGGIESTVLVAKYFSSLLDSNYCDSVNNLEVLLQRSESDLLQQQLSKTEAGSAVSGAKGSMAAGLRPSVKHPYVCCVQVGLHSLFIMHDMGPDLAQVMKSPSRKPFLDLWCKPEFRRIFYDDVAVSALNLVERHGRVHNDVRKANISIHEMKSFCLLDYDMASRSVRADALDSLVLINQPEGTDNGMAFTVAQIALVAWELERSCEPSKFDAPTIAPVTYAEVHESGVSDDQEQKTIECEVREVRAIWLNRQSAQPKSASSTPRSFMSWITSKPGLCKIFSSEVSAATEEDPVAISTRAQWDAIVLSMLSLESDPAP